MQCLCLLVNLLYISRLFSQEYFPALALSHPTPPSGCRAWHPSATPLAATIPLCPHSLSCCAHNFWDYCSISGSFYNTIFYILFFSLFPFPSLAFTNNQFSPEMDSTVPFTYSLTRFFQSNDKSSSDFQKDHLKSHKDNITLEGRVAVARDSLELSFRTHSEALEIKMA